ncbi:MAG: hypothetical protein JRN44_01255 [Nitrososphaerota archaeon]|jgi:hypothetical protein|nr:hypothetical protein [Nitrososphaerota archaeon]MDG6941694.1 hypothetical protein [Nitrososphaerota archaeon]MDG6947133.1 hypothetical protein [Nitrososphaerota archaeon]MDG6951477.1 hypothetical protein [Nitrososphaerota archaeon]
MQSTTIDRKVNLLGLKRFALEKLPAGLLRDDILSQSDAITPRIFSRIADCGSA